MDPLIPGDRLDINLVTCTSLPAHIRGAGDIVWGKQSYVREGDLMFTFLNEGFTVPSNGPLSAFANLDGLHKDEVDKLVFVGVSNVAVGVDSGGMTITGHQLSAARVGSTNTWNGSSAAYPGDEMVWFVEPNPATEGFMSVYDETPRRQIAELRPYREAKIVLPGFVANVADYVAWLEVLRSRIVGRVQDRVEPGGGLTMALKLGGSSLVFDSRYVPRSMDDFPAVARAPIHSPQMPSDGTTSSGMILFTASCINEGDLLFTPTSDPIEFSKTETDANLVTADFYADPRPGTQVVCSSATPFDISSGIADLYRCIGVSCSAVPAGSAEGTQLTNRLTGNATVNCGRFPIHAMEPVGWFVYPDPTAARLLAEVVPLREVISQYVTNHPSTRAAKAAAVAQVRAGGVDTSTALLAAPAALTAYNNYQRAIQQVVARHSIGYAMHSVSPGDHVDVFVCPQLRGTKA